MPKMVKRVSFKLIISICLLLYLKNVTAALEKDHEPDHDHDHDHDPHDYNAFYQLIEAITGQHLHNLKDEDAMKLLETLQMRFHMEDKQVKCFEILKQNLSEDAFTTYSQTSFFETSQIILKILINGSCDYANTNTTLAGSPVCRTDVNETIRSLEKSYENYTTTACFNEYTILNDNCTTENGNVTYALLTNLYEGNCILPDSSDLADNLFYLIGAEGEVVTEENFETLLSSLRIGSDEHDSHDHSHDHSHDEENHDHLRKKRSTDKNIDHHTPDHSEDHDENTCYSSYQLRSIYGYFGNLSREQVLTMCPTFLEQILGGTCSSEAAPHDDPVLSPSYTTAMKYGYGTASVVIISVLALVGIFFFPIVGTTRFALTMQFFIALGVGTMCGDAIFHILPSILGLHSHEPGEEHDHDHEEGIPEYVWKLLVVVGAIWALFIFENALKVISQDPKSYTNDNSISNFSVYENKNATEIVTEFTKNPPETRKGSFFMDSSEAESAGKHSNSSKTRLNAEGEKTYFWGITSTGIMVFLGDILHNFGDGIAIGAAFSLSWPQGVGTSLAIVFHELPHEFGDFAIYMNNGLSKCKALSLNFIAACCCFIGLYMGLALSEDPGVRTWLLSIVAGNFLYVSLVNVLKEMAQQKSRHPKTQFAVQNLGLFVGWTILFLLSIYEDALISSFG